MAVKMKYLELSNAQIADKRRLVISECIKRGINKGVKEFSISAWEEKTRKLYSSFGKAQAIKKVFYKKDAV